MTQVAGHEAACIVQGRIVNVNMVKWTVDVVAQFDRKRYFNIQVGAPYLHHSNGEGMYVFPEVGATCMVCLPSDSTAPFVLAYVMATETVDDTSPDAPMGTVSHGEQAANVTDASFSGGRPKVKPGDVWMRTRDNNFVILHRGGVLQIGATELAQRIFIPLNNLVEDISENYEHHNSNGSIVWGLQDGPSLEQYPSQYMQTFRVFATDKYADIKLAVGKVYNPTPEPDGGVNLAKAGVGQGDDGKGSNPIVYEVTVSPKGFIAESGDVATPATVTNSVLKFTFDRKGNTLLRTEGNLLFQVKKGLTFKATGAIEVSTDSRATMTAVAGFDVDGGTYAHIKGRVVRLEQGLRPVARQGDATSMSLVAAPIFLTFSSPPVPNTPIACTISTAVPMTGVIAQGNPNVLA